MSAHWIVPLAAAVANLFLAIVVYRSGQESRTRSLFCLLTLMLVFWNLHAFVLYYSTDAAAAFQLARVFRSGSLLVVPVITHLTLSLRERIPLQWRLIIAANYLVACCLIVANNFDLLVAGLEPYPWGFRSVKGPFYDVFTTLLLVNFPLVLIYILHTYATTRNPQQRSQLRFWLLGAAVALPLGLTQVLPAYGVRIYPLGNLGNAAFAGIVAYAILRHRLMGIDVVVTKGMAYAAVFVLVIAPGFLALVLLQKIWFGRVHSDFSAAILAVMVSVGVVFPLLRSRVESRLEQSLFRQRHQHRRALVAFTRSVVRILDRERLVSELATTLATELQLDRVAICLRAPDDRRFVVTSEVGAPTRPSDIPAEHPLVEVLSSRRQVGLREELESVGGARQQEAIGELCEKWCSAVIIPLFNAGSLAGIINLGHKRTLESFSAEDLELLETLGAEASIALENARLYEELRRTKEIIRRADRLSALGTLAAGIAHEIRNPLVSIQTFFQLAPERLHDEEFLTSFLTTTAGEVKRISDLISELLSFARSPTRTLRPVDLNERVERVCAFLEAEARKQGLALTHSTNSTPIWVSADPDQLSQVLINIVLNAIQATSRGGSVRVGTRLVRSGSSSIARLEVRDTGSGIPREKLDHIFDPFFTTKEKGTGLGLAIAHQIVSEHGGEISVASEEGAGTTFAIELPVTGSEVEGASTGVEESASLVRRAGIL